MSHILVDLDGTLAMYDGWKGGEIGEPIPEMAFRVKNWLADGKDVRIFTARASVPELIPSIQEWCEKHFGIRLPVTNQKDFTTSVIYDDRCIQVEPNTGRIIGQGK